MSSYLELGLLAANPFETVDPDGVGELVRLGTARGRATKPSSRSASAASTAATRASIAVFYEAGLDYVSCSPYRVPVARLAAAQAVVAAGHHDAPTKPAKAAKAAAQEEGRRPLSAGPGRAAGHSRGGTLRAWPSPRRTWPRSGRRPTSWPSSASAPPCATRADAGWGSAPSTPRRPPRSASTPRRASTTASAARPRGTPSPSCGPPSTSTSSTPCASWPTASGVAIHEDADGGAERKRRGVLLEAMERAVAWYHERLLSAPDAGRARDYLRSRGLRRRRGPPVPAGLGPRRLGRARARPGAVRAGAHRHRPGLRQPPGPAPGLLPGPGHLPHLRPLGPAGGPGRPHPAAARRRRDGPAPRAQVQELGRDGHLLQAPHPLRPQLGQARCRGDRRGGGVRGLHRRHRLLHRRASTGRGHLRHRPGRGALHAAAQLRQAHRPGLRRRQRRPGRGVARLRMGAAPRGGGGGGLAAGRQRSGRARPHRPRGAAPGRSPGPDRSSSSGSTGSWPPPIWPASRAGPGRPTPRWPRWPSTPTTWCATST